VLFENQWGSNGRNVPVGSSKVYREEVDNANPTMEASFESVFDFVSWKAEPFLKSIQLRKKVEIYLIFNLS
jgi:hypothetical protein